MLLVCRATYKLQETVHQCQKIYEGPVMGLPLFQTLPTEVQIPSETQAIVLTSAAALPAIKGTDLPVYCVGEQTAKVAAAYGLNVALVGDNDASSLADLIISKRKFTTLFHPHGQYSQSQWYAKLEDVGFIVNRQQAYSSVDMQDFPEETLQALSNGNIKRVVLLSPRSAKLFIELLTKNDLEYLLNSLSFYVISQAVADVFPVSKHVQIASKPSLYATIELLA